MLTRSPSITALEVENDRLHKRFLTLVNVQDIDHKVQLLVRNTGKETKLDIEGRLVCLGSLDYQAPAKPCNGRVTQLSPGVEETVGTIPGRNHKFTLT